MKTSTGLVILALAVCVAVLGYLYNEERKNDVSIKLEVPKVEVE